MSGSHSTSTSMLGGGLDGKMGVEDIIEPPSMEVEVECEPDIDVGIGGGFGAKMPVVEDDDIIIPETQAEVETLPGGFGFEVCFYS
jgi:hypothetical protein